MCRPRSASPKAIKPIFYHIVIFYVLNVLVLGMCVLYNDSRLLGTDGCIASASWFVIAIFNAITRMDHVINGCILVFVSSAATEDMYISSRTIYGLSMAGYTVRQSIRTDKRQGDRPKWNNASGNYVPWPDALLQYQNTWAKLRSCALSYPIALSYESYILDLFGPNGLNTALSRPTQLLTMLRRGWANTFRYCEKSTLA